jgi:hypothetical protein
MHQAAAAAEPRGFTPIKNWSDCRNADAFEADATQKQKKRACRPVGQDCRHGPAKRQRQSRADATLILFRFLETTISAYKKEPYFLIRERRLPWPCRPW